MTGSAAPPLRALVVDDEVPACADLAYLLREDPRVADVRTATSAGEALRLLADAPVDVIFCDIKMPDLDGIELARITSRFADRPQVVFVTAYDDRAVDAFELQAVDYLMKPVRGDRLAEAVRRVVTAGAAEHPADEDETITVELAGVTRFVRRSQIRFVEAQGDYARLHTTEGGHLVRIPLSVLEERWREAGFVRIHRAYLVSLPLITELRLSGSGYVVRIGHGPGAPELPVSRRHTAALKRILRGRPPREEGPTGPLARIR
jgi:DNA-binding LytR/AlgR family response regulator